MGLIADPGWSFSSLPLRCPPPFRSPPTPLDAQRLVVAQDAAFKVFDMEAFGAELPNLDRLSELAELLVVNVLETIWRSVQSIPASVESGVVIRGARGADAIGARVRPARTSIKRSDDELGVALTHEGGRTIVSFRSPLLTASLDVTDHNWHPRNEQVAENLRSLLDEIQPFPIRTLRCQMCPNCDGSHRLGWGWALPKWLQQFPLPRMNCIRILKTKCSSRVSSQTQHVRNLCMPC